MVTSPQQSERSLGRYQLLFMLGQGGMGEVHLAKLTGAAGFEKLCIVKTILPQMQSDPQFLERFHHEARVLVQLNHSNIAQVYDMGDVDDTLYMAIEYVAGVDLSRVESRVHRGRAVMPIPIALYVAQQVSEALGYAHRKAGPDGTPLGIVHRDVSPQNIMVSYEGEVKVIDFGLAKSAVRSQHTLPQTVMGKLGYMSPEQAMARPVDYRSDIFSAGIVVWEMLTGRPLYDGGTMGEMVAKMAHPSVESPRSLRPEISPALEQIIMRALQVDPAARYARADEFARALNELAVREGLTVGAEEVGNYVRAMCPEEFAAERALQSKLSMMRGQDATSWHGHEEEMAGTLLRPSQPVVDEGAMTPAQKALSVALSPGSLDGRGRTVVRAPGTAPGPGGAPASSSAIPAPTGGKGRTVVRSDGAAAESAEESVEVLLPRSRAPLYVVVALGVVGLLAVAGYFVVGQAPEVVATAEPARDPNPGRPEPRLEEPVRPEPEVTPDAGGPPAAEATAAVEIPKALGQVEVLGTPVPLRLDDDVAVVLLSKGARPPFEDGDAVLLIGAPDGTRAPLYAHGAVVDVKPTLVKIMTSESVPPGVGKLFAIRDGRPRTRPVPARAKANSSPSSPSAPSESKSAEAHKGEISPKGDVGPKSEPSKPRQANQLRGAIGVSAPSASGGQLVRIQSQNNLSLTGCTVRLNSNRTAQVQMIAPNGEVRLKYSLFQADARVPDPNFQQGWSAVYCREGTGYFFTTWVAR